MSRHIDFSDPKCAIEIERSEEFMRLAIELGNYMQDLPLANYQNDELIRLTVEQVKEAETNAFKKGFNLAVEYLSQPPADTEDLKEYPVQ